MRERSAVKSVACAKAFACMSECSSGDGCSDGRGHGCGHGCRGCRDPMGAGGPILNTATTTITAISKM